MSNTRELMQQQAQQSAYSSSLSAKTNPSIVKLDKDQSGSSEASQKRLNETQEHFLKMLTTQLKLQDPTNPTDTKEITHLTAQLTMVQQTIETNRKLTQIVEALKGSELDRVKNYIGQEVSYDVGEKEYFGAPVDFEFDVEYDEDYSDKTRYQLKSSIQIFNEEGRQVFDTNIFSEVKKSNIFTWNGINTKAKYFDERMLNDLDEKTLSDLKCPNGKYKIAVASEVIDRTIPGLNGVKVEASTNKSGVVKEVVNMHGKSLLRVNNDFIELDKIRRFKGSAAANKEKDLDTSNYLHFMDKKVSLEEEKLTVKNGHADIQFDNDLSDHGEAIIKVRNKQGEQVAFGVIDKEEIKSGKNTYNWHALKASSKADLENHHKFKDDNNEATRKKNTLSELPDGEYTYEVQIRNVKNLNKYERKNLKTEGIITSVKIKENDIKITVNGSEYSIKDIKEFLSETSTHSQTLFNDVASIIGKTVSYDNDVINLNNNKPTLEFTLPTPDNTFSGYVSAELQIRDFKGNIIQILKKSADELKYINQTSPAYSELNTESKARVDNFIKEKFNNGGNYHNISSKDRIKINEKIRESCGVNANFDNLTSKQRQDVEQWIRDSGLKPSLAYEDLNPEFRQEIDSLIREEFGELSYSEFATKEADTEKVIVSNNYNGLYENLGSQEKISVDNFISVNFLPIEEINIEETGDVKFSNLNLEQKTAVYEYVKNNLHVNFTPEFSQIQKFVNDSYGNTLYQRLKDEQRLNVQKYIQNRFGEDKEFDNLNYEELQDILSYINNDLNFKLSFDMLQDDEKKSVNKFINRAFNTTLNYETLQDKSLAEELINQRFPNEDRYSKLYNNQKDVIDKFIEREYFEGNIHNIAYDSIPTEIEKLQEIANRKVQNTFEWSAIKDEKKNIKFPNGVYKYELYVEKDLGNSSTKIDRIQINNNESVVREVKFDKGEDIFVLDNGIEVRREQLLSIKETI